MVRRGRLTVNLIDVLLFRGTALMVLALGAVRAAGALRNSHSVLGFGFAAIGGLSGGYAVRILLGDSSVARVGVDSSGGLTILANGLTAQVFDTVFLRKHTCSKQQTLPAAIEFSFTSPRLRLLSTERRRLGRCKAIRTKIPAMLANANSTGAG